MAAATRLSLQLPPLRAVAKAGLISGSVMAIGDVVCQRVMAKVQPPSKPGTGLDWERTARFAAIGVALHGPFFFTGYWTLDRVFGPSTSLANVTKKMLAGQATLFPLWLGIFFPAMGLLEGQGLDGGLRKLQANFASTAVTGSIFWPMVNMVNFRFVPAVHRVLYVNACGLVWTTFLSWLNAREAELSVLGAGVVNGEPRAHIS